MEAYACDRDVAVVELKGIELPRKALCVYMEAQPDSPSESMSALNPNQG